MKHINVTLVLNSLTLLLMAAIIVKLLSDLIVKLITKVFYPSKLNAQLRYHEARSVCFQGEFISFLCGLGIVDVMRIRTTTHDTCIATPHLRILLGKKSEEDLVTVARGIVADLRRQARTQNKPLPTTLGVFVAGHGYIDTTGRKVHPYTHRSQYRKPLK